MIHDPQDPHASGRRSRGYGTMLARLGKLRPGEELTYQNALFGDMRLALSWRERLECYK